MVNKDELKGKTKSKEGKIKEGTGKIEGNKRKVLEGKMDQPEGKVHKKLGQVERKAKRVMRRSMIFQKILVPLDGSEHSGRALETAVQVAKNFNSKLVLLTVNPVTFVGETSPECTVNLAGRAPGAPSAGLTNIALEAARCYSEKILAEAEAKVRSEKVEVETALAEGEAVEEIVKKSKEGKSDLIVMGARGLGSLKSLLVVSVSEGVIRNAPCPVLIVK